MGWERTIVLADDDVGLLATLKPALQRRGWEVVAAVDAEQALLAVDWVEPEVVVLDAELAGAPAGEICAALRRDERTAETPVIVISAEGSAVAIEAAFRCGAVDYLTEPFDVHELDIALRRALDEREARRGETVQEEARTDGRAGRERQPAT